MATELLLPLLGDIMTEGTVTSWLQPDGAEVEAGQPLYELESDKVTFTVEAPGRGVLRQLVAAGRTVPVGALVGRLDDGGEVTATPAARRLARELGVDLSTMPAGRRIREDDVRAFQAQSLSPAPAGESLAKPGEGGGQSVPYAGRRKVIGERMLQSRQNAASLTHTTEVRVDAALDMIDGLNREWEGEGVVVTLTRLAVKACAIALRDHPLLNARLEEGSILVSDEVNIGLAVDQDDGLIVAVLDGADKLSLKETSRALRELTQQPRPGQGATFTVTSLAGTVVDAFTPIINPPEAAILGLGRVREVPAFEGTNVVRHRVTTLSLTFDHRILDGAPAARFLGRLTDILERPYLVLA